MRGTILCEGAAEAAIPSDYPAEAAVPSDYPVAEAAVLSDCQAEAAAVELPQSPVPSNIENGDDENELAGQHAATESEGDGLQHSGPPQQSAQAHSPELAVVDTSSVDTPDPETLQSSSPACSQRIAAQCQRQLLQQWINDDLVQGMWSECQ